MWESTAHRAASLSCPFTLVRSRRAPPVPLIVLPKSCSCRWGPCPRPIPRLACLFSFFLSFSTQVKARHRLKSLCGGGVPFSHPSLGFAFSLGALARPEGAQEGGGHGRSGQAGGRGRSGGAARRGAEVAPRLPEPEWHRGESGRGALLPGWDDRLSFTQTTQSTTPRPRAQNRTTARPRARHLSYSLTQRHAPEPRSRSRKNNPGPDIARTVDRVERKRASVRRARLLTSPAVYTREKAPRAASAPGKIRVRLS